MWGLGEGRERQKGSEAGQREGKEWVDVWAGWPGEGVECRSGH